MKIRKLENKIPEVWAAARVIVQKYGHTKKFAKHIVALVIKRLKNLTDVDLSEYVSRNGIGKMMGYRKMPHPSTFSKVRERANPAIFEDLNNWIILDCMKGKNFVLLPKTAPTYLHIHTLTSMHSGGTELRRRESRRMQREEQTRCSSDINFTQLQMQNANCL